MLEPFLTAEGWLSFAALSAMEIVLGIDNIVFLSILAARLPREEQPLVRRLGLSLALILRLGLLLGIYWLTGLVAPLFAVFGHGFSGRDLILIGGGIFLVIKSTQEIYDRLEGDHHEAAGTGRRGAFWLVLGQILALDVVFSLDSVITAVGMARQIPVMVAAMVVAVGVMLVFAASISNFINRHPSMKVLALSFLLLIGVVLVADGMGQHVSKGYIYFAMAFSLGVEALNMRLRKKRAPVALHRRFEPSPGLPDGHA